MSLGLRTHQVGLEASIEAAVKKVNRAGVAVKVRASDFTQPLGKMSAKANEFTKSLEASNARVIAFGASAAIIGGVTTSFVQLVVQAQKVEKILGDINAVLGASAATLQQFGDGLFNVARNTSQALEVAAEAALEFSRQGLSMEETLKRTNDALILTRLTGLAAADSVKGLTAAVNGFADAGLNTTEIINKLAAVDVKFAVSAEDLINSLARAGAVAQDAGVSFDQLIGAVTSAQQITARGGAVIGNSFKTIFTRIQRSSTLDRLEELGIAVRDLQGNTLPALTVLTELSRSYETLGAATKAAVAEQVGGVFQINILKAALKDLGRENSLYSQATITSSKATNEAYTKNAMLQKTLSSIATQTLTTVRELTANLGELTIAPALKEFLENINGVLKTVSDLLGTDEGESIGADFAKGLARAVGSVLSGPGLFGLVMVFGKLFGQAFKFAKDSVKDLLQIKSIKDQERMIQESIVEAMMTNVELSKQLVRLDGDQVKQEKLVLAVLREQTATIEQQRKIATNIAPALRRSGVQPNLIVDSKKNAASGHIPSPVEKLKERSGAKKAGYIAGEVSTMSIPRLGRVVYNKKEKVKKFKGMDQPAIMPPEYSKAGKQYRKNFTGKHGFDPYAHSGMVPNFVRYDKSVRPWRALPDNANAKGYGGVFTGREVEKMRNDGWARTDAKGWHFVGGGRKAVDRVEKKARDDNRDMILGASAMRRGGKMIVDNKSGQIYHGTDHQQIAQQNNLFENGKLPRSMIPVHMQKEYDPTIDKDVNKIFVRAPSASSLNPVSMRKLQSITEKDYGVLVLDAGRGFTGGQKVLYDPNNFYGNFSGMSEGLIPNYSYYAPGMEDFYRRNRNPKSRDRNKKKASRKDLNLEFFYPSAGTGGGTIFKMYKDIIRSAEAGKPYTNILAGEIIGPRIPKMIVEGKKLIDRSRQSGKKIPKMQIDGTLFPSMLTRKIDKFASDRRDGYIHPPVDYMPGEESEVRKYLQTMGVDPDSHSTVRLQDIYKGGFNSGLIPNYVLEAARLGNTNILKMPKAKMITETTASNFKGEKIKGWKTLEATLDNISKSAQSYRDEFAILKSLGIDVIQRPFYFSDQTSKIDKKEMRKISKAQRLLRGSSKNSFAYKNQHKITGSSYESSLEGSALSSQGYRSTWEGEFNKQGIKQGLGDQNAKVDFIKAGRSPLEGKYGKYTAPNLIAKSIRLSSDQYIESFLKKHGQSDIANLMSSKKLDDSKKLLSSMGFSDPDASTVSKYRLFNGYLPRRRNDVGQNMRTLKELEDRDSISSFSSMGSNDMLHTLSSNSGKNFPTLDKLTKDGIYNKNAKKSRKRDNAFNLEPKDFYHMGLTPNFASQNWRNQRSGDPQRGKHEAKATKAQILKAIKLVLKNRGVGKTAMGSNKIDFASERYMSATKTREYPGGYVNIDGERINMNEITLALKKHGQYHPSFADDDEFDGSMNHKDNIILDDSQQNHLPNFMRSMRGSFGRSPLKFGIGGEKSFGKSYLGTTSKSGKMFLLQEGYPHFSSYMEKMGKPKPELKAGNFGGRAGYWVNNYENDVRTWAELPNTKILDLDRKRKDEKKKLDADRLARTKAGVFDPVLTNGNISFSDGSTGFVNTDNLTKRMGEQYKHLEVDKIALKEYAKQNAITRRSIGSDIPDLPKALSNIAGMPRNQLLALKNIVRPRAQTKTEADVDKFFKSPKRPIKWDVRDDDKGKKQFNLKADDATFLHFTEFLKKEGVPQRSINNIHTALADKRQSLDDIADRAKEKRRGGRGKSVFFKAAKQQEAIEQGFSIPTNSLYIKNLNQLVREFNKTVYSGKGFAEGLIPNFMIQSHILNNKKLKTASGTISGSVPYEKRVHTPNSWTHFKPKPNQRLDGPRGTLDGLTKNIKKLDKPSQKARISKEDFRALKPSDDWWIFQTKGGRLYENMLTPFIGKAGHNSHLDYDPYSIKNKDVISNDGTAGSLRAGFSVADAHAGMGHPEHLNVAKLVRSGKLTRSEIESHMTSGKSYDASANDGFVEIVGGRSRDNTHKSKFGMKASTLKKQGFLRSSFPEKTPSGAIKRFSMSYYQDAFRPTSASGLIPNFAAWNPFTRDSKSIAKQGGIANSKFSLAKIIQSSPFKHQLTRYGHWNNFPPDVKKRLNQWLRSQGYANRALQGWGLLSKHSKSIASGVNDLAVYNGHVPNFSSPLTEAISREKHALREQGSSADIYIDQDNRLKNPKNPAGLLVANTRDEPKSGSQGVNRAISMGMDPKRHGASDGVVPNFSKTFMNVTNKGLQGTIDKMVKNNKDMTQSGGDLMMKMMALTTVTYALEGAMGQASEEASTFQKSIGVANAAIMGLSQAAMLATMLPKGGVSKGYKTIQTAMKTRARASQTTTAGKAGAMAGKAGTLMKGAGSMAMGLLGPLGIAIAVLIPVVTALKDHFGLFMSATETATKHLEGLQSGLANIEQATQAVTSMQGRQSKIIELENVGKDRSIAQEKEYLTLQIEEMKNRTTLDNAINKVASSFDLTNEENISSNTTQKLLNGTYKEQIEVLQKMEQAQLRLINMASGTKNLAQDLEGAGGNDWWDASTEEQLKPFLQRSGVDMVGQMGLDFSGISDTQLSLLDDQIEALKNSFSGGADELGEIDFGIIKSMVENLKGNTVSNAEKDSLALEIQKRIQAASKGADNAGFSEERQERSAGVTLDAFSEMVGFRTKASRDGKDTNPNEASSKFITALKNQGTQFLNEQNFLLNREVSLMEARLDLEEKGLELQKKANGFYEEDLPSYFKLISKDEKIDRATSRKMQGVDDKLAIDMGRLDIETNSEIDKALAELMKPEDFAQALFDKNKGFTEANLKHLSEILTSSQNVAKILSEEKFQKDKEKAADVAKKELESVEKSFVAGGQQSIVKALLGYSSSDLGLETAMKKTDFIYHSDESQAKREFFSGKSSKIIDKNEQTLRKEFVDKGGMDPTKFGKMIIEARASINAVSDNMESWGAFQQMAKSYADQGDQGHQFGGYLSRMQTRNKKIKGIEDAPSSHSLKKFTDPGAFKAKSLNDDIIKLRKQLVALTDSPVTNTNAKEDVSKLIMKRAESKFGSTFGPSVGKGLIASIGAFENFTSDMNDLLHVDFFRKNMNAMQDGKGAPYPDEVLQRMITNLGEQFKPGKDDYEKRETEKQALRDEIAKLVKMRDFYSGTSSQTGNNEIQRNTGDSVPEMTAAKEAEGVTEAAKDLAAVAQVAANKIGQQPTQNDTDQAIAEADSSKPKPVTPAAQQQSVSDITRQGGINQPPAVSPDRLQSSGLSYDKGITGRLDSLAKDPSLSDADIDAAVSSAFKAYNSKVAQALDSSKVFATGEDGKKEKSLDSQVLSGIMKDVFQTINSPDIKIKLAEAITEKGIISNMEQEQTKIIGEIKGQAITQKDKTAKLQQEAVLTNRGIQLEALKQKFQQRTLDGYREAQTFVDGYANVQGDMLSAARDDLKGREYWAGLDEAMGQIELQNLKELQSTGALYAAQRGEAEVSLTRQIMANFTEKGRLKALNDSKDMTEKGAQLARDGFDLEAEKQRTTLIELNNKLNLSDISERLYDQVKTESEIKVKQLNLENKRLAQQQKLYETTEALTKEVQEELTQQTQNKYQSQQRSAESFRLRGQVISDENNPFFGQNMTQEQANAQLRAGEIGGSNRDAIASARADYQLYTGRGNDLRASDARLQMLQAQKQSNLENNSGSLFSDTIAVRIAEANSEMERFGETLGNLTFDSVQQGLKDVVTAMADGTKSMKDALMGFVGGIANAVSNALLERATKQVTTAVFSMLGMDDIAEGKYRGGLIQGYASGGSTSKAPAMLTAGEYVVRKKIVDRLGTSSLNKMNKTGTIDNSLSDLYSQSNEDSFDMSTEGAASIPPIMRFNEGGKLNAIISNITNPIAKLFGGGNPFSNNADDSNAMRFAKGAGYLGGSSLANYEDRDRTPSDPGPTAPVDPGKTRLNTSSSLDIDPTSRMMSARFRKQDSYSQQYGDYLLAKYDHDIQKQNAKVMENAAVLQGIAGNVTGALVGTGISRGLTAVKALATTTNNFTQWDKNQQAANLQQHWYEEGIDSGASWQSNSSATFAAARGGYNEMKGADLNKSQFAQASDLGVTNRGSVPNAEFLEKSKNYMSTSSRNSRPNSNKFPQFNQKGAQNDFATQKEMDDLRKRVATAELKKGNNNLYTNSKNFNTSPRKFNSVAANREVGQGHAQGQFGHHYGMSTGGRVHGPSGRDQVGPVMLDKGEYVIRASSVNNIEKKYPGFFDKLNSMKMNEGGLVTPSPKTEQASPEAPASGGGAVTVNINVSSGGGATAEGGGASDQAFAAKIKDAVVGVISQEKRVGGMLNG